MLRCIAPLRFSRIIERGGPIPEKTQMMEKIQKSSEEWAKILNKQEFDVIRNKGTEPPRSGEYDKLYPKEGYFKCRACDFPLYSAKAKFDSGCGWPAYNACFHSSVGCHVKSEVDNSVGMERIEILCARCDGHLGHVFYGEKGPNTERHCVNSVSVKFDKGSPNMNVTNGPVEVKRSK